MTDLVWVLNCGSSSIKAALFDAAGGAPPRTPAWRGQVDGIGSGDARFGTPGTAPEPLALDAAEPYHDALAQLRARVRDALPPEARIAAVAHRVVHGGSRYAAPVRVDAAVLADLKGYIPLAPLHQPFALDAIEVLLATRPDLPQVACFDTAFHHTLPDVERMLPLDWAAWQRGLRRYGFHGLSYEYLSIALPERWGDVARGRTVVAHLGSGASLCAMQGLRSVATTMGFSALDGLMMGSRCGALDPGALLYLMQIERWSVDEVGDALYHRAGLRGLSGLSGDPRVLLAHEADAGETGERCRAALALYVRRIVREIGALAAVLQGLDLLVFTAGIGEHNAEIRRRVVDALGWLGVAPAGPAAQGPVLSAPGSAVQVVVEPTNEEWVCARHALGLLGGG